MREVRVDEFKEQVLLEVVGVLRESGREGLVEVVEGWDRERKDLLRTIDILEGVINNEK